MDSGETVRTLNKRKNFILYPMQNVMGSLVHLFMVAIRPFVPSKYKEKLSEIEKSKTFINVIGLSFFNSLGGLIVMLTNIKIANVLGAEFYGLYSYFLAIGEVGSNFVRYGRNKTMTRDLIQKPLKFDGLVSNTLALGTLNFILFFLGVVLFRKQMDVELSITSILLIMAPCIVSLDFVSVYESLKEMNWHSIYYFIQRLLFLLAVWSSILCVGGLTLSYLGITLFLSWTFIEIVQYKEVIIGFNINLRKEISWRNIRDLYKSNFVIALCCLAGVAFGPIIRMILKDYADTSVVGVYSAGMQIFLISSFLMHQVSRVGNPMMAEAGKENVTPYERKVLCKKYFRIMFIAVLPFAIPLVLFPQFITDLCYTDEYSELGKYLPLFAFYLISLSFGTVYTQFLISMKKDILYFVIYVGSAVATVLTAFLLIPIRPLFGAIFALCVPHSIGCLFYYLCSIKYFKSAA